MKIVNLPRDKMCSLTQTINGQKTMTKLFCSNRWKILIRWLFDRNDIKFSKNWEIRPNILTSSSMAFIVCILFLFWQNLNSILIESIEWAQTFILFLRFLFLDSVWQKGRNGNRFESSQCQNQMKFTSSKTAKRKETFIYLWVHMVNVHASVYVCRQWIFSKMKWNGPNIRPTEKLCIKLFASLFAEYVFHILQFSLRLFCLPSSFSYFVFRFCFFFSVLLSVGFAM